MTGDHGILHAMGHENRNINIGEIYAFSQALMVVQISRQRHDAA